MAYVNSAKNNTGAGSPANTLTVTLVSVTSGNTLSVCINTSGAGTSVTGVTDDKSNTYTRRVGRNFRSGAGGSEIWTADNVTGGTVIATVNTSGVVDIDLAMVENSGRANPAYDANGTGSAATGTAPTASVTASVAGCDVIAMLGTGAVVGGVTAATGTLRQAITFSVVSTQDNIISGPNSSTFSQASAAWQVSAITLKPAVKAPVFPVKRPQFYTKRRIA
jgi:hypothetical protein